MSELATLYVRDVPEPLYERLRARARTNGRSLNAEVLEILAGIAEREHDAVLITERLRVLAAKIDWPPDAPTPEELIREGRDRR